jgi:nucleolar protein 56
MGRKALKVLYESSIGYVVVSFLGMDEIGAELSQDALSDFSAFQQVAKVKGFQPFQSTEQALEDMTAIGEHRIPDSLRSFLELTLPTGKSHHLGVLDPGLGKELNEAFDHIEVENNDTVKEVIRAVRLHLHHLIEEIQAGDVVQSQLALAHSLSRSKIQFSPARNDTMIIQAIAILDNLDKDINTFAMRVREWYSYHFPELKAIANDNIVFARLACAIGDKANLLPLSSEASEEEKANADEDDEEDGGAMDEEEKDLRSVLLHICSGNVETVNAIVRAGKSSMGYEISDLDMENIVAFSAKLVNFAKLRLSLTQYLRKKMANIAPNLSTLVGDHVAARLIQKAGSLTSLAKCPASTIQILGAEKALFRALKGKTNTPKYGLIYHSPFIGRANAKNKGRISRYLANKCAMSVRIDAFADEPTARYGEEMRKMVEERLNFYERGAKTRKNADVMEQVRSELAGSKKMDEDDEDDSEEEEEKEEVKASKKKDKKRKKRREEEEEEEDEEEVEETPKKKKKSKKDKTPKSSAKKKKKKKSSD